MEKTKVLFISQEITPYLPKSDMSTIGRYLPQGIQENGKEIRAFMPRYGLINERRNQLHEVIRLSGMNLVIDDTDHSLIIKVASIQAARMQVYFIDNEDFFNRKAKFADKNGKIFKDNDERAMFFARGVLETVKKLRWSPDVVHCHGWFTGLVPLYLKNYYKDDPIYNNTKVVYSVYNDDFNGELNSKLAEKLKMDGIADDQLTVLENNNFENYSKLAINMSDAIIQGAQTINNDVKAYALAQNKPFLEYHNMDEYIEAYSDFYDALVEEKVEKTV